MLVMSIDYSCMQKQTDAAAGGVLKSFAIFTGKHLCWSLFFKKRLNTGVFLLILRNFYEHSSHSTPPDKCFSTDLSYFKVVEVD